jgi:drug/metabolite transporter (DMT)-like permease
MSVVALPGISSPKKRKLLFVEIAFVFGRLVFSILANVYQKKLSQHPLHPFFMVATSYVVLSVLALPLVPLVPVVHAASLPQAFWVNVLLAALLDVGGWMFMVMSLAKTDLSVFGPLNAYKVVISMLLAIVFLGEVPTLQGFAGVAIIVVGSFFLMPANGQREANRMLLLLKERGVQARFLSILLFSIGTLFLKNAVTDGGPLATLVFWSLLGLPLVMLANLLFIPASVKESTKTSLSHLPTIASIGVMIFIMQYCTLVLLSHMLVAYTLALFQMSMVLQVLVGYQVFKEKDILRKLIAAIVMMLGSLLVISA